MANSIFLGCSLLVLLPPLHTFHIFTSSSMSLAKLRLCVYVCGRSFPLYPYKHQSINKKCNSNLACRLVVASIHGHMHTYSHMHMHSLIPFTSTGARTCRKDDMLVMLMRVAWWCVCVREAKWHGVWIYVYIYIYTLDWLYACAYLHASLYIYICTYTHISPYVFAYV